MAYIVYEQRSPLAVLLARYYPNSKEYKQQSKRVANIGIKHGFSRINIRQVPWDVLKTEAEGGDFQRLTMDMANVNALKNHVRSLLLHKN